MLMAYLGGYDVTLTIPLLDDSGNTLNLVSADYRVLDQNQTEIVPKTALVVTAGDIEVSVLVTALQNVVSTTAIGPLGTTIPNTRDMRIVEVYVTTDVGVVKIEKEYLIEAEEVLLEGVNSFQPYSKSLFVAETIQDITTWNESSKRDRINALIRAREHIAHLRFRYVFDAYQNIVDNTLGVADLSLATEVQWNAMPQAFKEALRRAQIIEADAILGGDDLGDLRRDGVMSMTVGEAKQFFRPVKPLSGPVSRRTYNELAKWVLSRHRLGRM
jgi:hypothetical protein